MPLRPSSSGQAQHEKDGTDEMQGFYAYQRLAGK